MFTGIVTAVGTIQKLEREADRLAITVGCPYQDLELGESIAVDGTCLTVVDTGPGWFRVDAIVTTRSRTRFADMQEGDSVNLERSLQVSDRLGGHLVQGHVDGRGEVVGVRREEDATLVDVRVPEEIAELSVPHGSVTIDGVSLTINRILEDGVIQVALIPYTLEHTNLDRLQPGSQVHIEGDMIGKFVRQMLQPYRQAG